jgi:hypothetical protein
MTVKNGENFIRFESSEFCAHTYLEYFFPEQEKVEALKTILAFDDTFFTSKSNFETIQMVQR